MLRNIFLFLIIGWLVLATVSRAEVVEELNLFREAPLTFAAYSDKSLEELKKLWPESLWRGVVNGAPPLERDEVLCQIAAERAGEILSHGLPLPEGFAASLEEAFKNHEYRALLFNESYAILAFENPLPEEEARHILLETLFAGALDYQDGDPLILYPCWKRVGVAFKTGELIIEGKNYYAAVLVLVFATVEEETEPVLLGRVYGVGEEGPQPLAEAKVTLKHSLYRLLLSTETWPDGSYCLIGYPAGFYYAQVSYEQESLEEFVFLPPKAHHRDFYLSLPF